MSNSNVWDNISTIRLGLDTRIFHRLATALANLTATCVGTQYSQAPPPSNAAPPPTLSNPKASIVSSGPYASIEALGLDKVGGGGAVEGGGACEY